MQAGLALGKLHSAGYPVDVLLPAECYMQGGAPIPAAEWLEKSKHQTTDLYCRARAYGNGFPDGLGWLARLPEAQADEEVLRVWEEHGGFTEARTIEWLRHVTPALERKKRYWEVFVSYCYSPGRLDDAVAYVQERNLQDAPWGEGAAVLDMLLNELCGRDRYVDAAEVLLSLASSTSLAEHYERLAILITRAVARSRFVPGGQKERVALERVVLPLADVPIAFSPDLLTLVELGAAIERTNNHNRSIEFYSAHERTTSGDLQRWMRQRWISCTRRRIEYFESRGPAPSHMHEDLTAKAAAWNMVWRDISAEPLFLSASHTDETISLLAGDAAAIRRLSSGNVMFEVGELTITITPQGIVSVQDAGCLQVRICPDDWSVAGELVHEVRPDPQVDLMLAFPGHRSAIKARTEKNQTFVRIEHDGMEGVEVAVRKAG